MQAPVLAIAAAILLIAEGAALAVTTVPELFGLASGSAANDLTAIALIVLTLIGAGALVLFGFGVRKGHSWARSGGIVAQVLALALVGATLTMPEIPWTFVLVIAPPALLGLVLLVADARRAGNEERAASEGDARADGDA